MFSLRRLLPAVWLGLAVAREDTHTAYKHHILVGNFGTNYNVTAMLDGTQDVGKGFLYTLVVDAYAKSLTLEHTYAAAAAHPWLSVNVRCRPLIRHRTF
jgi:hypothetical protein